MYLVYLTFILIILRLIKLDCIEISISFQEMGYGLNGY
jgi:hypothetical protein